MIEIWSGLLLGVMGSAHCALMCGPFAAAVAPRGTRAVIHHSSRIAVYAALGTGTGFVGSAITSAGAGRALALLTAVVLVGQAAARWKSNGFAAAGVNAKVTSILQRLRQASMRYPPLTGVGVGIVNGLLPCGLVYAALIASIGMAGSFRGAAFMAAFGIGTTPAVMLAARLAGVVTMRQPTMRKLAPAALVLLAIMVAVRGWSGVPLPGHHH